MSDNNVVEIEENLPHFDIIGLSGNHHIIPVMTVERMADGTMPLRFPDQEDHDDDMIRGILLEWLEMKA